MLNVIKVRLYPNKSQQSLIHQHFGSCRLVYNLLLDAKIKAFECNDNLSIYDLKKRLVPMKNVSKDGFLKLIDSTALQNSILTMDKAYKNFFRRVKLGEKSGFPKFKSKHNSRQSYQTSTAFIKDNKLYLPKIGFVKAIFHRDIIFDKISTVTISFEANQFFASINYESSIESLKINSGKTIGIDVGIKVFAYTSENKAINPKREHNFTKDIEKMIRAQKELSRKKIGSKNRIKAKERLAKRHLKIKNKRNDFLHKITKELSENQTIKVEDLKIKNMSKQAKGSIQKEKSLNDFSNQDIHKTTKLFVVENPNMRSSAKSGLNRMILQQSWGKFFELLEYKLKRNGGELIRVNPKNSSLTCSCCDNLDKKNRKTQAKFECTKCGFKANADYNASLNIQKW